MRIETLDLKKLIRFIETIAGLCKGTMKVTMLDCGQLIEAVIKLIYDRQLGREATRNQEVIGRVN